MDTDVIQTQHLTKRYGNLIAVDSLDFSVHQGEIYGLLGPNGSGKTTTILMLLGLTEPTSGKVSVLGEDPVRRPLKVKARVGYLPDQIGFYDNLTARENLIYIAKLNGLPRDEGYRRIDEALDRMGLTDAAYNKVGTYSRGMHQRLGVAELLIKQPQIIIMDEPTLGLDPEATRRFLQIILELKQEGITILLASHLLHQVQQVCDRVGLFRKGKIALEGTMQELTLRTLGSTYYVKLQAEGEPGSLKKACKAIPGVEDVRVNGSSWYVVKASGDLRPEVAGAVIEAGGRLKTLEVDVPSLDEIYAEYFHEEMEVQHVSAA